VQNSFSLQGVYELMRKKATVSRYKEDIPRPSNKDDEVRQFLARSTIVLIILDLGAYLLTRDITLLLGGTVIASIAGLVFTYYFKREKR
jgi:hypothetical protein